MPARQSMDYCKEQKVFISIKIEAKPLIKKWNKNTQM